MHFSRPRLLPVIATALAGLAMIATPARAADAPPPPADEIHEKLAAVDHEVARLREAGLAARAEAFAVRLPALRARAAGKPLPAADAAALADQPELHVIGVYQGDMPGGGQRGFRQHPQGTVDVDVRITDRPLVLALCAYEPVKWQLKLADGVRVERILLSGYYAQEVANAPAGATAENCARGAGKPTEVFYAYKKDSPQYASAQQILTAKTGLPIATFQGLYVPKGAPFVLDPADPDQQRQRLLADLEPVYREATAFDRARRRQAALGTRFKALHWQPDPRAGFLIAKPMLADFTPAGPIEDTVTPAPLGGNHVAVDPRTGTWYAIAGHGVRRLDPATNQESALAIDPNLPKLSWPCGLAFDTKRHRLILTSLGGVGYMYAYDPAKDAWSVLRDMANLDLTCFTYSAADDRFYGLAEDPRAGEGATLIYSFDGDGKPLGPVRPSERLPVGRGPSPSTAPQLIPLGDELLLLTPPGGDDPRNPTEARGIRIDPKTGRVIASEPLRPQIARPAGAPPIHAAELAARWRALRDATPDDAVHKAISALAAAGDEAVAVIRANVPDAKPVDPQRVAQLIARLDHEDPKTRDAATAELNAIAGVIEPQLRAAHAALDAGETRNRIAAVMELARAQAATTPEKLDPLIGDPDLRLRLRAIRVLARVATPAAVDQLHRLATGAPGMLGVTQARTVLRQI